MPAPSDPPPHPDLPAAAGPSAAPSPPPPPANAPRLDTSDPRCIVLIKGDQRFPFDCPPGGELSLLQQLPQLVADPANPLNWFDAAVLSHEVGERMSRRLDQHTARKKTA